jgi:hypothetical protein
MVIMKNKAQLCLAKKSWLELKVQSKTDFMMVLRERVLGTCHRVFWTAGVE